MSNSPDSSKPSHPILFVDLDGTLVATDVLWESYFRTLKGAPWIMLLTPLWLLRGRAGFKRAIAERGGFDAKVLPYREEVVAFIRDRRESGGHVVLATASDRFWAEGVASSLGLFDAVIASDGSRNLKGVTKLAAIEAYCTEQGASAWGYMGDSSADVPIWKRAHEVHVVNPSGRLLSRITNHRPPTRVFGAKSGLVRPVLKAMRVHQWVKNVLLFVPLLLAHQFTDVGKIVAALAAFLSFSLCASAVYLMNDLLDVEADRLHPKKRKRPFAAGHLPLVVGPGLALTLVAAAFGIAVGMLPPGYVALLVLYMVINALYSGILKSKLLVDVFILAGLYTLRLFAGGVATELKVSEWLLAFSIFFFTSLAFVKRYVEMARLAKEGKESAKGRGYRTSDLSLIEGLGPTNGYLAVVVFALYINSDAVRTDVGHSGDAARALYANPSLLWLTCPLMLYWISRLWFLAKRDELNDDPVVFAVTDKTSLVVGALMAIIFMAAAAPIW